jgi:3-methyl-2-oxobutanoate hydroxymethyltransferase
VANAGRFVHEANAEVMKCEGNKYHAKNIEAIVRAGIPVQGHIGITPMRMPQLGGFVAQGKTAQRAKDMVEDAKAMVDAGCFSILCEVTTSEVAEYLAQTLPVPVISLGAGNAAHGVHIISSDLFHLWEEHVPRHSRIYTDLIPIMEDVISRYMKDVVNRNYPGPKETVFMSPEECLLFAQEMKWERKVDELRSAAKKTA